MIRRSTAAPLAISAVLGLSILTSAVGAVSQPHLRSARAQAGHVVVVYTLGDNAPLRIVVATRRITGKGGGFPAKNVRLRESLPVGVRVRGDAIRARTRQTLRPGRYFVQISARKLGSLDCTPHKPCPTQWSNVLPVRVPKS